MYISLKHPCVLYMCKSNRRKNRALFALTRTTQCCVHMILQARLCLCQVFSGSEQHEKVRHSNRISQYDLFTPRLSLLHCPPLTPVRPPPSIPSWHRWRWVAPKSHSARRVGLQRAGASASHVLTISSVLCEIMQIF